jgi:hypothetical protein
MIVRGDANGVPQRRSVTVELGPQPPGWGHLPRRGCGSLTSLSRVADGAMVPGPRWPSATNL